MLYQNNNFLLILLARMDSKRFPKKIFAPINTIPIIKIIVDRLKPLRTFTNIVVATSDRTVDDPIYAWCLNQSIDCFRGSSDDVLKRFLEAAEHMGGEFAFRINGDSPLVDASLIKEAMQLIVKEPKIFITTRGSKLPYGIGVEVIYIPALKKMQAIATEFDKEHITSVLYRSELEIEIFRPKICDISDLSFTVDWPGDITKIKNMIDLVSTKSIKTIGYQDFVNLRRLKLV